MSFLMQQDKMYLLELFNDYIMLITDKIRKISIGGEDERGSESY